MSSVASPSALDQRLIRLLWLSVAYPLEDGMKVFAHRFRDENRKAVPYWRDVGTLDAYYQANMDLVAVEPVLNMYDATWPIRTLQPPRVPSLRQRPLDRCVDEQLSGPAVVRNGLLTHCHGRSPSPLQIHPVD